MMTITHRPFAGEADLEMIAELLKRCEAVDQLDEYSTADELRREFETPGFDIERGLRLWLDADQTLIGFGQLWIDNLTDGFLWFRVDPTARNGDLDHEIIAWAEGIMREEGRRAGTQAELRCFRRVDQEAANAVLEQNGFTIARYWWKMARALGEPIPEPNFPDGITLRHVTSLDEAAAWTACFNESFIDHHNHHPLAVEERLHTMAGPDYRFEHDLIAVDSDGTFAAFDLCEIRRDENARTGRNEGWISKLGVRRGYRRTGLGRAILLAGLQLLAHEGLDTAVLVVDATSPTGANHLYESVGFRVVLTWVSYVKVVE